MLSEAITREMRVTVHHIDNDRAPCDNVALLGLLIEEGKRADDVGAESVQCERCSSLGLDGGDLRY